ncbi:MAG: uracil-DNA glycosylase [Marinoscillum sp.]|jgi:uracil-DNA glycosylase
MQVNIEKSWKQALSNEFAKPYFHELVAFVKDEYKNNIVYPQGKHIFTAFEYTPFDQVKVVILGQDPYHGPNQAHGLSFSVKEGVVMPPSLVNIFKELSTDLGLPIPPHGNLEKWAKQGVLLLNATLTVQTKAPGSHQNKGWESFTDAVIESLAKSREGLVFILWGANAQKKGEMISLDHHFVIQSPHPSPFSAYKGFFGSKPFSKTNDYLASNGIKPISW